jgi:hypothetical protein
LLIDLCGLVFVDEVAEGWDVSAEDIAQLSPYITEHIARFGMYATDVFRLGRF